MQQTTRNCTQEAAPLVTLDPGCEDPAGLLRSYVSKLSLFSYVSILLPCILLCINITTMFITMYQYYYDVYYVVSILLLCISIVKM